MGLAVETLEARGANSDSPRKQLIVFTSDHGAFPWAGGSSAPLRGSKVHMFEGGVRVPAFVSGSALESSDLRIGRVYHGMSHVVDLMPTVLQLSSCTACRQTEWAANSKLGWDSFRSHFNDCPPTKERDCACAHRPLRQQHQLPEREVEDHAWLWRR